MFWADLKLIIIKSCTSSIAHRLTLSFDAIRHYPKVLSFRLLMSGSLFLSNTRHLPLRNVLTIPPVIVGPASTAISLQHTLAPQGYTKPPCRLIYVLSAPPKHANIIGSANVIQHLRSPKIATSQAGRKQSRGFNQSAARQQTFRHRVPYRPSKGNVITKVEASPNAFRGVNKEPKIEKRPEWQKHKLALREKFGNSTWNPQKRLSPDALEGIRELHEQNPDKYTTAVLAEHFKVSHEAIRRILKGRWRPNDGERLERRERWERRGQSIWARWASMGMKSPRRWRDKDKSLMLPSHRNEGEQRPRRIISQNSVHAPLSEEIL